MVVYSLYTVQKLWFSSSYPEVVCNPFAYYFHQYWLQSVSGTLSLMASSSQQATVGMVFCYDLYNGAPAVDIRSSYSHGRNSLILYFLMIGAIC